MQEVKKHQLFFGLHTQMMLDRLPEIESYYRPAEITVEFEKIIELSHDTPEITAQSKERQGEHGTYTIFTLEHTQLDKGQVALFLDGVHTNEMIGGRAIVELFKAATKDPDLLSELATKKLIYYHQNPEEMELNGDSLVNGDMSVAEYLKNAHRSAKHVDWMYPPKLNDKAGLPATQNAMDIMKNDKVETVVALHNSGVDNPLVYVDYNCSAKTAQALSDFMETRYGAHSPPESVFLNIATRHAPGVYSAQQYESPDGAPLHNSGSYIEKLKGEKAKSVTPEIAYFTPRSDASEKALSRHEKEALVADAQEIDELLSWWRNRTAEVTEPPELAHVNESINMYYQPLSSLINDMKGSDIHINDFSLRMDLHFYPSLMLGHALRGAKALLTDKAVSSIPQEDLVHFIKNAEIIIDKVAKQIEPLLKISDRRQQVGAYLGVVTIRIAGANSRK